MSKASKKRVTKKKSPTKKKTARKKAPKKKAPAKKNGRPIKYDAKWVKTLPDMFKNGESVPEVAAKLGICKDSFYEYIKKYPEFSDAYKKGLALSEAWWTRLGRLGSAGRLKVQPATWIFNMKNRFKWQDKIEHSVDPETAKGGVVVPIVVDRSAWEESAKRQQELLARASADDATSKD